MQETGQINVLNQLGLFRLILPLFFHVTHREPNLLECPRARLFVIVAELQNHCHQEGKYEGDPGTAVQSPIFHEPRDRLRCNLFHCQNHPKGSCKQQNHAKKDEHEAKNGLQKLSDGNKL